jgi:hypothetical protein
MNRRRNAPAAPVTTQSRSAFEGVGQSHRPCQRAQRRARFEDFLAGLATTRSREALLRGRLRIVARRLERARSVSDCAPGGRPDSCSKTWWRLPSWRASRPSSGSSRGSAAIAGEEHVRAGAIDPTARAPGPWGEARRTRPARGRRRAPAAPGDGARGTARRPRPRQGRAGARAPPAPAGAMGRLPAVGPRCGWLPGAPRRW